MELASIVLQLLLDCGGRLNKAVSFRVEDLAKLYQFVKVHLSNGETLTREKLNFYLADFQQERKILCTRAIGLCFVAFAYHILLECSPEVFPTMDQFLAKYSDFADVSKEEQERMHFTCKTMIAALRILKGKGNKETIREIVGSICAAKYITGGGKVIPVEKIFIQESGIVPEKSNKGKGKGKRGFEHISSGDHSSTLCPSPPPVPSLSFQLPLDPQVVLSNLLPPPSLACAPALCVSGVQNVFPTLAELPGSPQFICFLDPIMDPQGFVASLDLSEMQEMLSGPTALPASDEGGSCIGVLSCDESMPCSAWANRARLQSASMDATDEESDGSNEDIN